MQPYYTKSEEKTNYDQSSECSNSSDLVMHTTPAGGVTGNVSAKGAKLRLKLLYP